MTMAFNPSPKVADCREIAQKWGNQEQVIILAIDSEGRMQMATYGRTSELCSVAQALGNAAWKGIEDCIAAHERTLHAIADANDQGQARREATLPAPPCSHFNDQPQDDE